MTSKKKIVIIGANGYIARNLIYKIITEYYEVFQINLYDIQDIHVDGHKFYNKIDLLDKSSLDAIDFDCELIFLFSGITGTVKGFQDYETFIKLNEIGLLNLLDTYKDKKSSAKIIFPSTRLIYKGQKDYPIKEGDEKEFLSIYALNKFSAEQYIILYSKVFGVKFTIFRLSVVYGSLLKNATSYGTVNFFMSEGEKGNQLIIFGDGSQNRTFIHINDLCDAILLGSITNKTNNDIFNIGGFNILSVNEVVKTIAKKYGTTYRHENWSYIYLKTESGDTILDSSKFDSLLNFKYKTDYYQWITLGDNF